MVREVRAIIPPHRLRPLHPKVRWARVALLAYAPDALVLAALYRMCSLSVECVLFCLWVLAWLGFRA